MIARVIAMLKRVASRLGVLSEFLEFLWANKLYWMIPMVVILVIFGTLLVMAQGSAVAPFIYTLF